MLFMLMLAVAASCTSVFAQADDASGVAGTWTGESICTDPNRPACKNEMVVYRVAPVEGKPKLFAMYADKIINGERVPMYKLEFTYDAQKKTLTCEFFKGQTHGIWSYTLSGDEMEGTLIVLPGKQLGRKVKVHRVSDDKVPKAPPLSDYEARALQSERLPASAE
jgi:hypothetical protein